MNTLTVQELEGRLARPEPVQLVMALQHWAYERLHIPGSLNFENAVEAAQHLSRDREVVVYCTNPNCAASYRLYYYLLSLGFTRIARFAGGIEAWMEAGLTVEGSLAASLEQAYA